MLVKCVNSFRHQIIEGDVYLVVEILVRRSNDIVSYRVIDAEGFPSIYDSNHFEIVTNNIDNFAVSVCEEQIIISHKSILNSKINKRNVEGFWGAYIEDDVESKEILKNVVCSIATIEGIDFPLIS